jgi:hypothetical protein
MKLKKKTVQLRMKFPDQSSARSFLEDCRCDPSLSVNILRGRMTENEASFLLEVTGDMRRIDDLILESALWSAPAGRLAAGVV